MGRKACLSLTPILCWSSKCRVCQATTSKGPLAQARHRQRVEVIRVSKPRSTLASTSISSRLISTITSSSIRMRLMLTSALSNNQNKFNRQVMPLRAQTKTKVPISINQQRPTISRPPATSIFLTTVLPSSSSHNSQWHTLLGNSISSGCKWSRLL